MKIYRKYCSRGDKLIAKTSSVFCIRQKRISDLFVLRIEPNN